MAGIALEYMERMGIKNTQFFIAQHFDKEHPHVHIAFNRIGQQRQYHIGQAMSVRAVLRICKELTLKYGLHMAGGKDNVKRTA
ncbi:relaxase/mobilization nuclease domain-containing protein [Bacteroides thetaiotaomicron]|nr:relaxase/mobilization nuclease domain-containing protein [Bacteroides thetaiotaomicron]